jgi:DHA2 family multidrug resistance protein
MAVITAICIPAFLWWELKTEHPIVDLRLFKNLTLFNGAFLMSSVGGMLYALIFFIPIFSQLMLNMNATQTGNLFMPSAILSGLMMPVIGMQLRKHDPRMFIFYGLSCSEIALFMIAHFSAQSTYWNLFWPLMIRGAGMSSLFVPINAVVLGQFTGPKLGQAAGIMNLSRQIGGSVGIAVFATMFKQSQDRVYHNLVSNISPLNLSFNQWAYSAKAMGYKFANEVGMFNANGLLAKEAYFRVQKQAFVVSFDYMMWIMALAFSLTLIPTFFLHRPAKLANPADAH